MTPEELEDDGARPKAPLIPGLTPMQQAQGQHLARIHDMYRRELTGVERLMADIRAGIADPAQLPAAISRMSLTQNLMLFGSVCGRQCALLQNHHDLEEQWMFPAIGEYADSGLRAVLDRLKAEHKLIHALIVELWTLAQPLAQEPSDDGFEDCATAFARLNRAVRSHFGYEEVELAPAIGAYGIGV
ncbi:MAG: hemerythrin domain-containing protein [Paracoccus sp. (in: a-proteobacteria)]|nr:hemerythrin domain-containing protein [Paracoccus sp. (in: a-proteobacteria)]